MKNDYEDALDWAKTLLDLGKTMTEVEISIKGLWGRVYREGRKMFDESKADRVWRFVKCRV